MTRPLVGQRDGNVEDDGSNCRTQALSGVPGGGGDQAGRAGPGHHQPNARTEPALRVPPLALGGSLANLSARLASAAGLIALPLVAATDTSTIGGCEVRCRRRSVVEDGAQ